MPLLTTDAQWVRQPRRRLSAFLDWLIAEERPPLTIAPPRQPDSLVPPNWAFAVGDALEELARRYHLPTVQVDFQGMNKRFPAFRDEFWKAVVRRL